ncbi:hypothetical protein [Nocardioides coralli]|uniref:hypothetical protein n=1 Tax=Nocardioides coralli TaxID=2872154 RepID=UPI001CA45DA2|nr:hypothetical protein [Nocardioides coralli]QZY30292.1 hypothetical protein K6T13_06400 [Nocardioides coralli]
MAGPLAVVATLSTVGVGVLAANPDTRDLLAAGSGSSIGSSLVSADVSDEIAERQPVVSRDGSRIGRLSRVEMMMRPQPTAQAVRNADTRLWTTTALDLWTSPLEDGARKVGVVEEGKKVLATGREAAGRVELAVDGESRWVTAGYLTDAKPEPEPEELAVGGACTNGSSVSGQPNVLSVHEAVCANFPEITSYGTYRGDGEHAQGIAIDIMVSGSRGWEVAEFVRANYQELGVSYVIYAQKIWSVDRASEGWRYMEDRGSVTANHYDHVHVTTY